jgi:ribosome biogenesis protein Nip4
VIVYISDPKNSTRELQPLINTLSKVAGYKTNKTKNKKQKTVAFLYTSFKRTEKEIRERIPFTHRAVVAHAFNPNLGGRGGRISELEVSLVYTVGPGQPGTTQRNPVSKNKTKQNKTKQNKTKQNEYLL